jgi:hypothetical protein
MEGNDIDRQSWMLTLVGHNGEWLRPSAIAGRAVSDTYYEHPSKRLLQCYILVVLGLSCSVMAKCFLTEITLDYYVFSELMCGRGLPLQFYKKTFSIFLHRPLW